jgi:predicted small secreted protein
MRRCQATLPRNIGGETALKDIVLIRNGYWEIIMVRRIIAIALVAGGLTLSACNTVEGAGKDVKSAGTAIEKAGN